ncbi:MAG: hypothetical protein BA863_06570 [Desulfovibrio sp. S3730MH75]|nr:MAG: hypothetical protein BA863_06570 [Desulfovibrio sp. S3730MH75]
MNSNFRLFLRLVLLLSAICLFTGCELKSKPIDIGPTGPRPKMGLKLKVVEGEKYMKEPFWEEYERTLLIMSVKPESPAAAAGVLTGDLLLKIDGQPVHGMQDSIFIMRQKSPGSSLLLDLYRNHETKQFGIDLKP